MTREKIDTYSLLSMVVSTIMTTVSQMQEEMSQLQLRMEELAKAKQEKELATELEHTSIDHNLTTLKQTITSKEEKVEKFCIYSYNKSSQVQARMNNAREKQEIVHLSAIYNILSIMNTRLSKLEEK